MKLNNVNLNIVFNLGKESEMQEQVDSLSRALSLLSVAGIEVSKTSAVPSVKETMGNNERLFLRLSGQKRMRITDGSTDREAYAADLVLSRYPANVAELNSHDAIAPQAADTTPVTSESEDDNDLI